MAKSITAKIKLVSTADTGYFYVTKKNTRTMTEKMSIRKYDPVARKHVEFKESQDQVKKRIRLRPRSEGFAPSGRVENDAISPFILGAIERLVGPLEEIGVAVSAHRASPRRLARSSPPRCRLHSR